MRVDDDVTTFKLALNIRRQIVLLVTYYSEYHFLYSEGCLLISVPGSTVTFLVATPVLARGYRVS